MDLVDERSLTVSQTNRILLCCLSSNYPGKNDG
jgi:hypothetical protein